MPTLPPWATFVAFSVWVVSASATPAAAQSRWSTPVFEGHIEEHAPRRDELGYFRVPRLEVAADGGGSLGDAALDRFHAVGTLRLHVPLGAAVVVGGEARSGVLFFPRDLSDLNDELEFTRRTDVAFFARLLAPFARTTILVCGDLGWSRVAPEDQSAGSARDGLVAGPQVGLEVGTFVRTSLTASWRVYRYGEADLDGSRGHSEFSFGLGLQIPIWRVR